MSDEIDMEADGGDGVDSADSVEVFELTAELVDELRAAEASNPGLFVSGWAEDEEGVATKDMMDPGEQVLTAAEDGDVAALDRLLDEQADLVNVRDSDLYTPLHRAAYNNHAATARRLLERGADPTARTEDGWLPLHCAACWGCADVARLLLDECAADVNARTSGQLTPLHLAAAATEDADAAVRTARLLLEQAGVDVSLRNGAGDTAAAIARRTSRAMAALFEQFAATTINSSA